MNFGANMSGGKPPARGDATQSAPPPRAPPMHQGRGPRVALKSDSPMGLGGVRAPFGEGYVGEAGQSRRQQRQDAIAKMYAESTEKAMVRPAPLRPGPPLP
jgi:hypothetical protein